MNWYWCLEHKCTEQDLGCGSTTRIGPYPTQTEAMGALERLRQREAAQTARDEADEKKYGKKRRWLDF